MSSLTSISPLDGRYYAELSELSNYFSEMALMRYRLVVEVEYFIALSLEAKIKELPALSKANQNSLRNLYRNFSTGDAAKIKETEKTTNHDVKAVEYFLKEHLKKLKLQKYSEFVHFALTSEDVNNLSYTMMWHDALWEVYRPAILNVQKTIWDFAKKYKAQPMLALTHGQSATPTTVGKEFAVFASRLERQINYLKHHNLQAKLNGATATWGAHSLAYPQVDWPRFSAKFITALGFEPNLLTTQIEPHDSLCESYQIVERINNILLDFTKDIWLYVSRGIFGQQNKAGEIGSSAMPHKINPIQFENAEGNLGLANAYFSHLTQKLPISRMQRDLSDSTVLRNQGVPLAHSLLACQNILKGMSRLTVNKNKLNEELENHWEVLAEAVQTIMRKVGYDKPYEKLKEMTRGHEMNEKTMREFISKLDLPKAEKDKLLKLTPQTYTGLADKLVREI